MLILSSFLFTGVEQRYAGVLMSTLVEEGYGVGDVVLAIARVSFM